MESYQVLYQISLDQHRHKATGLVKHFEGINQLPRPDKLQIIQFRNDKGFYLLYLDIKDNELTDTYHDSVLKAMQQAKYEFGILENEWKRS